MARLRLVLPMLAMLVASAMATPARATPNFPKVIQARLGLAKPPDCIICHDTNAGGLGTAIQPFAEYLKSRGLRPFDEASLQRALDADQAERHDCDGDGVPDIVALELGRSPNAGIEDVPHYGCGASIGRARDRFDRAAIVVMLGIVWAAHRSVRRRKCPSRPRL